MAIRGGGPTVALVVSDHGPVHGRHPGVAGGAEARARTSPLDRLGGQRGLRTSVYLQVNTSGEENKYGFDPGEAVERAAEIASFKNLDLDGMMTIGPATMDPEKTRSCFRQLYKLREKVNQSTGREVAHLSMGMTGDFEMAIEEGATVIRLGRILTGERTR